MATTENVIQSNKLPDSVDSFNLEPWDAELYQEVLHNSNQSQIDSVGDAFNSEKLLDHYSTNGKMRELYENTGFFVPQAKQGELTFKEDVTTVGIENGLGLFTQLRVQNFETHDDLSDPPNYQTVKSGDYARLVELGSDGSVTDSGKVLMSTKLDYVISGLLATMGLNQKAGVGSTITKLFMEANQTAAEVAKYITPDGKSIYNLINEDGLDTTKIQMYFPAEFIDKFGDFVLAHPELFQGGGREIVNPVLNETYDANNPLPIGGFIDNDFVFNYPTGADANTQAWFDDIAANFGSVSAAAATLFNHAFETYKTAYDANATMVARYGELNSTNFYIECKFNLSTFNSVPMLELEMVFIPYTKYRNGDCGISFDTYDTDYVNSGEIAPNPNQTYSGGRQIPYNSSRLWDTLRIKSNMLDDGTFDVGSNMPSMTAGNPGLRVFGMATQSGEGYKYWFFDNFHLGTESADFDKDPNAVEFDENSGTLSQYVNNLTGAQMYKPQGGGIDFPNYCQLTPLKGSDKINSETTHTTQGQMTQLQTYADLTHTNYPWNSTPTTTINYVGQQQQQIADLVNNYIANHPSEHSNSSHNDVDISNPSTGEAENDDDTNTEETIIVDNSTPSGMCEAYKLSTADITAIGNILWSETFFEDYKKHGYGNVVTEAVISLNTIYSFIPLNDDNTTTKQMWIAGMFVRAVKGLNQRYSEMTVLDIKVEPHYRSYLDYTSVQYKIYLPNVGYVDLSPVDVLDGQNSNGKTLRVKFVIDWYTGMGAYNLYSRKQGGQSSFIGSYQANFASSIPISQRNFQAAIQGCYQALSGGAMNAISSGASGAGIAGSAVMGAAPGLFQMSQNRYGTITQKGNITANGVALAPKKIYLLRTFPNRAYTPEIKRYKNYPDYRATYIANLKGSGLCSFETTNLQGNFSCTNEELEMIKQSLNAGVIL